MDRNQRTSLLQPDFLNRIFAGASIRDVGLEKALHSTSLFIDQEWRAGTVDSRLALRRELSLFIEEDGARLRETPDLMELNSVPRQVGPFHISISHCGLAGGFAATKSDTLIGLDIEDPRRVTRPIVERMSTRHEIETSPDLANLWCAKEAAFKCLSEKLSLKVLSQISIRWISQSQNRPSFFGVEIEGQSPQGYGFAMDFERLKLALFYFPLNFGPVLPK